MPRPRRLHVPGGIYHVTLRGNHRQQIFHRDDDFRLLERLLQSVVEDHSLQVHAYCWMPNHLHFAMQVGDQPLARPMQQLGSSFARHVQAQLATTGHLFERRYHAVLVDTERYLLALVRYIHLNPVRAAIVPHPELYRWSSHNAYLTGARPSWLTTDAVLRLLAGDPTAARAVCARVLSQSPSADEMDYLRHGPRRPRDRPPVVPAVSHGTPRPPCLGALSQLVREECQRLGVDPQTLSQPGKNRRRVIARAMIAWRAELLGLGTLGELSPILGRSPSSLSEGLIRVRGRHPDLFRDPYIRNSGTLLIADGAQQQGDDEDHQDAAEFHQPAGRVGAPQ